MKYTFGHTDTAAARLKRIADFFNPLAADIIQTYLHKKINTAADFGCGPGFTTDMLARATGAIKITGIDISSYFLDVARHSYPHYNFLRADVTKPDNKAKYDFIYCRFLLSHLINVDQVIAMWMKYLKKNSILFIDELEAIQTNVPVFEKYLHINNELIRSQGAELYIGETLNKCINGYSVVENRSDVIPVADSVAASWFHPNTISVWKDDPFVRNIISEVERQQVSEALLNLNQKNDGVSNITWKMKRILLTT